GYNLNAGVAGAYTVGRERARIDINGTSNASFYYIYQWNLGYLRIRDNPTVTIYRQDIANSGHRTDIWGGTVTYTSTGATYNLQLYTNNNGWGWYATGGHIYFNGSIGPGNIVTYFRASGTAVLHFVGSQNSVINLIGWASSYANYWDFNDLRIEKTGGASLTIKHTNTGPLTVSPTAALGVTVNSGAALNLFGLFSAARGYDFAGVLNNGALADSQDIYCSRSWINNGSFSQPAGNLIMTLGTNESIVPGSGNVFNGLQVIKTLGRSVTLTDSIIVKRQLILSSGRLLLNGKNLTLGTSANPCSVRVWGGRLLMAGTPTSNLIVRAASESYPWSFRATNCTLETRYNTFLYPDTVGMVIGAGAVVDPAYGLNNCSFEHGAITGPMLRLNNAQMLDSIHYLDFNATAGGNIAKDTNVGHVTVAPTGSGTRWGADYEIDPYNRIDWVGPDVGVSRLLVPSGVLDSGLTVTPACSVYNYGTSVADYMVRMKIGASYDESVAVVSHAVGTALYLTFPDWTATVRGPNAVSCSTGLAGDVRGANNIIRDLVLVRIFDVGGYAITAPSGPVDSGIAVPTQAVVRNWGNADATFDVKLFSDDGFSDTRTVFVAAGADSTFDFANWTPTQRGTRTLSCSTMYALDVYHYNDKFSADIEVNVHDQGVAGFQTPGPGVPPGPMIPQPRLRNFGTVREGPVLVKFFINALTPYEESLTLAQGLPVGVDTVVDFPVWTAEPGSFTARCSVYSATDQNPVNDVAEQVFLVATVDVGVTAILSPPSAVDTLVAIIPSARVVNLWEAAVSFYTRFRIDSTGGTAYEDSALVSDLPVGGQVVVTFPEWPRPHPIGNYTMKCSTRLAGDEEPANDARSGPLTISAQVLTDTGWITLAEMPAGAKGKKVKDGGCLAYQEELDTGYVYALKGNGRCEFYKY
ncbi:MAG: hypothetical protein ABIK62_07365, partial [candidate division WOR-3 bacterium]